MKKYLSSLTLLLLGAILVSLSSCGSSKSEQVKITVPKSQQEITLFFGGEAVTIQASVKPSKQLRFTSENPGVATVDGKGVVKPVAKGVTTIKIEADKADPVSVKVQVLDLPTIPSVESKLPMLRFFFASADELIKEVSNHEKACGRTAALINLGLGREFNGFQNLNDDFVTNVIYDMKFNAGAESRIWVTCPAKRDKLVDRLDGELRKLGFGSKSESEHSTFGTSFIWKRFDGITAYFFDLSLSDLKGESTLFLIKERVEE